MNDFYIGYIPKAPPSTRMFIRRTASALVVLAASVALVLVAAQQPFPAASFEDGQVRTFAGVVRLDPVPSMELDNGRRALLVAPGKHGADALAAGLDSKPVDLSGMRIQRGGDLMIEVLPGTIRPTGGTAQPAEPWTDMGAVTLRGEIADSKCYLGVMNPGEGKVHRDCAVRCISGGVPPALIVADRNARRRMVLLTGPQGRAIHREVLDYVGEPAAVEGRLFRRSGRFRIEADPRHIVRLQ